MSLMKNEKWLNIFRVSTFSLNVEDPFRPQCLNQISDEGRKMEIDMNIVAEFD